VSQSLTAALVSVVYSPHPLCRFKGELFGLGSNHTKYKSKTYGQNNGNGAQQLQYSTSVHYPTGMNGSANQTMAPGNFSYEEGY
jgi:hypothetical protein